MTPSHFVRLLTGAALGVLSTLQTAGTAASIAQPPASHRLLLLVVDGLRPDQITPEVMPRLHALGQRGVTFTRHHSVFPTVTRVNASSLATGTYAESHGLLGNTVYSPRTFAAKGVNTSSHEDLDAMTRAEGTLLTAPTLGAILEGQGKRLVVFSAGSSGSALLLSHPLANGAVVNPDMIRPAALAPAVLAAAGPGPAEAVPNDARNRWMVDAYIALGATTLAADVTAFWFGDPDATAHQKGLGAETTTQALRLVDGHIARIEDALRARGQLDTTNILVVSDHGFSTHTNTLKLAALVAPFARPLPDGTPDLVVTEGAINLRGPADPPRLSAIVSALQGRDEVGAIFTAAARPGAVEGSVPGTLSYDVARWQHPRSGAILVSGNWSDAANAAGFQGTTTQSGVAGHGTSSPFDIHNTFLAAGPDIRTRAVIGTPTSNADIAPTMLTLLHAPVPASMTGRVVSELLRTGPAPEAVPVTKTVVTARTADGSYQVDAHRSAVGAHVYLDQTVVRRPR